MPGIQEPLTDFHGDEARFFFFKKKGPIWPTQDVGFRN